MSEKGAILLKGNNFDFVGQSFFVWEHFGMIVMDNELFVELFFTRIRLSKAQDKF
jgi:hypothetical protein